MKNDFSSIYKIKISIHNILVSIQLYIKSSYKMKLIIVESPAKCKTLQKYVDDLGDYVVLASAGHIREIAKNGIDEKNNFKTKYTKIRGKAKYINQLKASASNADEVIIATDADREGSCNWVAYRKSIGSQY